MIAGVPELAKLDRPPLEPARLPNPLPLRPPKPPPNADFEPPKAEDPALANADFPDASAPNPDSLPAALLGGEAKLDSGDLAPAAAAAKGEAEPFFPRALSGEGWDAKALKPEALNLSSDVCAVSFASLPEAAARNDFDLSVEEASVANGEAEEAFENPLFARPCLEY